jgi:S1-C subfamily serine protease
MHRKVSGKPELEMLSGKLTRILLLAVVLTTVQSIGAQTPPRKPRTSEPPASATQVVTVVHRINGLKLFRLLLRSEQEVGAIANLDETFNFTDDVHTNIIAGLAMEDGRTIAAWLPEAEVELAPSFFSPVPPPAPEAKRPKPPPPAPAPRVVARDFAFRSGMLGSPDLTVIGPDGRQMAAEYIGFDGATGLSILRLSDTSLVVNDLKNDGPLDEGESVRLFNPEPAANSRGPMTGSGGLYVRMGTTPGTVLSVKRAPAGGGVARFKVKSPRLSLANIGGVAVNEAGETIGIVDAIQGYEATILPTALIRRAARRVLTQHASVPRPWLGVKGEPVARMNLEQIRKQGWKLERAASLLEKHRGILLTSIAPNSPASLAALRAGDVILKVDNEDIQNADDFSWLLDQAGPSKSVTFTLARPDQIHEEAVSVELSGWLDPSFRFGFGKDGLPGRPLLTQGIETIGLEPGVAARLGANSGLLIVFVDPSSAAFNAGLMPGDVIESINGKPLLSDSLVPLNSSGAASTYSVVRKKNKLTVIVPASEQKK